jgi:ABC-2 type transport system permease protein
MKKTLIVFKNELISTINRKSFILTLVLFPIIGLIITLVIGNRDQSSVISTVLTQLTSTQDEILSLGVFDESRLIVNIPSDLQDKVKLFDSSKEADQALETSQIKAYYLIPTDYLEKGEIIVYRPDFNPLAAGDDNFLIEKIINSNLLVGHPEMEKLMSGPPNFETELLIPEPQRDPGHQLTFFLPYIVTLLFYIIILSSSSLMLNSVTNEKSNRVMEILLTSITPLQMLSGKIIALGVVGLLQTIVWSGTGLLILRLSGSSFSLPVEFQLPVSILLWGIVFFICGYMLYASLMAGIGALVSNLREASQATTIVVIPMVIPLMFLAPIIENPNGSISTFLSLFPLTSPVSMMTRLAAGSAPLWQLLLSIALLLVTSYLVIRSVSRFFHAQYLLSGKEFKLKFFLKAMVGKA